VSAKKSRFADKELFTVFPF